jgi:hypothetical protein
VKKTTATTIVSAILLFGGSASAQVNQEQPRNPPQRRVLRTFAAEVASLEQTNPTLHAQWRPVVQRLQARRLAAWMTFGAGLGGMTALFEAAGEAGDPDQCDRRVDSYTDLEARRACLDETSDKMNAFAIAGAVTFVSTSLVALAVNPWRRQVRSQRERFLRGEPPRLSFGATPGSHPQVGATLRVRF